MEMSQEDLLPDGMPTMQAYEVISTEFSSGSGTSYTILVETAPRHANSTEIRDLRNPEALRFMKSVANDLESLNRISSVSGPSDLFKDIPAGQAGVEETLRTLG
ncbi:MAG: hypothetical protein ABEJ66_03065, partial [Candidatus Nanohaloarchaea archaeon]